MYSHGHTKPFIYIDICKTASTSLRAALSNYGGYGRHTFTSNSNMQRCALKVSPTNSFTVDKMRSYDGFTFTFVRNPWERLASYHKYCMGLKRDTNWKRMHTHQPWLVEESFGEFVRSIYRHATPKFNENCGVAIVPQTYWISDDDGHVLVNFVGRYEHLTAGWEYVCNMLNWNTSRSAAEVLNIVTCTMMRRER